MPKVPLYQLFGRFIGRPLNTSSPETLRQTMDNMKEIARDHGLTTRFLHAQAPDDIGKDPAHKARVNFISDTDPQGKNRIVQIALG